MNRVSLNTAFQVGTRGLELASGLLVNAWLARHWGSAVFGQIGLFANLTAMCAFLFDFGLSNMLMRHVSCQRERARALLVAGLAVMLPLSALGTAVVVALGLAMTPGVPRDEAVLVLVLSSLQMVLGATSQMLRSCFYAYERMELESYPVISERACWLVAGVWLAVQPPSLVLLFAVMVATRALNVGVSAALFVRVIMPLTERSCFSPRSALALVRQAVPFGLNQAFYTFTACLDVVLIASWSGDEAAGHYRAASMLMAALTLVVLSFVNSVFPRMAAAAESAPGELARYQVAVTRLMMLAALPACLFIALYAPAIVAGLYGEAFAATALLLGLLALALPLRFLDHALGTALTACNRQDARMRCAGAAALVNLVANLLLIGPFGAAGACMAGLVASGVAAAMMHAELRRHFIAGLGLTGALQGLLLAGAILVPAFMLGAPMLVAAVLLLMLYPLVGWRLLTPFESGLIGRTPVSEG